MGRKNRTRGAEDLRQRVERALARGDTRDAVETAKQLVREEPGEPSAAIAVRAYVARVRALIDEGLGREAASTAALLRERFPAHAAAHAALFDEARLAASDLDWLLRQLPNAAAGERAAIEERLLPWIGDPSVIVRSTALDASDPLAREARILAETLEIVAARPATSEELAPLGEIRRRSPLAPWKLLVRAIAAFHAGDDERARTNAAAIDARSPAARAGRVIVDLIEGRTPPANFHVERLVDRISGGRASIAQQFRALQTAAERDDRRTMREALRELARAFDKLSPYAFGQVRIALLRHCGPFSSAEQLAGPLRLDADDPESVRYPLLVMESVGLPVGEMWVEYADAMRKASLLESWQAAEIYLHALEAGGIDVDSIECDDPTHDHGLHGGDVAAIVERILALEPTPSVIARVAPFIDRVATKAQKSLLQKWRKADPAASAPVIRLLRIAEKERSYEEGLALIRKTAGQTILDPEYARLRLRITLRSVEQHLGARKNGIAEKLLDEIASRAEDLPPNVSVYLDALRWAASPPAAAGQILRAIAAHGALGEIILAEVCGHLEAPYPLPLAEGTPAELIDGITRGIDVLGSAGKSALHTAWVIERIEPHLDHATESQLLTIARAALLTPHLVWAATGRAIAMRGPLLHRALLLRVELIPFRENEQKRLVKMVDAAYTLAKRAHDVPMMTRARELLNFAEEVNLSQSQIDAVVAYESTAPLPQLPSPKRRRAGTAKRKTSSKKKKPAEEKGLFDG